MTKVYRIKQGLDIKLKGEAESIIKKEFATPDIYAIKPTDFAGLTPKLSIREGDSVKAGTPLFHDKAQPEIQYVSPISGIVKEVKRGERRRILEVIVSKNNSETMEYKTFNAEENAPLEDIKNVMLEAGIFPSIKQRPYDIVANPNETPKAIFISAFDSAPLSLDYDFIIERNSDAFKKGIEILSKFAPVHISIGANSNENLYNGIKKAKISIFKGKHPAGNVGVQINKISPINKDEIVWTIAPQDIIILGKLFINKKYDAEIVVALCGSEVNNPLYFRVLKGAKISSMLKGNLKDDDKVRIISGNVLTGEKVPENGFLGFYANQITVIPEGDDYEFLGWAMPGLRKMSMSKTFFSWLTPSRKYRSTANLHGEERAFVVSGEYEKVFPMNILPVQLLKAIMSKDIDKMEQLGIYEIAPEDFALCEFVCTSKIESQRIVREGLDYLKKELS